MDAKYQKRITEKIYTLDQEKVKIRKDMNNLKDQLERKKFEHFLLEIALNKPMLTPASRKFKEYMHITQSVEIPSCEISIYPVWIELECIFPPWSLSVNNTYPQILKSYNSRDNEIIIDAIARALNVDFSRAKKLQEKYNIYYNDVYNSEFYINENVKIDFNKSETIHSNSRYFKRKSFNRFNNLLDTPEVNLTLAKVKYLLILPLYISI